MSAVPDPLRDAVKEGLRDPGSKLRHIEACLGEGIEYRKTTGLEHYDFVNEAAPDLALGALDTSASLLGKPLKAPIMIAPMTGGTPRGHEINRRLALAAQRYGLAMGVGSQRIAIESPERAAFYRIRELAPDIPLFANLGAAQLARGYGAKEARRAVEMIGADAIFIHFNALQEVIQDGDRDFRGVMDRFAALCTELANDGIPVFAREVCFGLSTTTARRFLECGASGIDCSGAGGTSWAKVEAKCARSGRARALGERFGEWGIPTSQSVRNVRRASYEVSLVASGGLRSGIDVAKAIALGADIGAMARPFLIEAHKGQESLDGFIEQLIEELRVCMFATGSPNVAALRGRLYPVGAEPAGAEEEPA